MSEVQEYAPSRRTVFWLVERGMGAIVEKGTKRCRKLTHLVARAFDPSAIEDATVMQKSMAVSVTLIMRARCGLCPHRLACKRPLA